MDIVDLVLDQVAHVRTGFRSTEQAGFVIDDIVELLWRQISCLHRVPRDARIQVTQSGAHCGNPAAGVNPMLASMLLPSRTYRSDRFLTSDILPFARE